MEYDFQRLADVELLEEVPDGASAFVAVDGTVKRVPGSGLGSGGVATAILRLASESNASTKMEELPITCDNYTYEQARAVLGAGNPLTAMIFVYKDYIPGWRCSLSVALYADNIVMDFGDKTPIYWNDDGFFSKKVVK